MEPFLLMIYSDCVGERIYNSDREYIRKVGDLLYYKLLILFIKLLSYWIILDLIILLVWIKTSQNNDVKIIIGKSFERMRIGLNRHRMEKEW